MTRNTASACLVAGVLFVTLIACKQSSSKGSWSQKDKYEFQDDCLRILSEEKKLGVKSITLCECMGPKAEAKYDSARQATESSALDGLIRECGG